MSTSSGRCVLRLSPSHRVKAIGALQYKPEAAEAAHLTFDEEDLDLDLDCDYDLDMDMDVNVD